MLAPSLGVQCHHQTHSATPGRTSSPSVPGPHFFISTIDYQFITSKLENHGEENPVFEVMNPPHSAAGR